MDLAFFSPQDMLVVMAVALIVFGPQKLPEVGRQLGGFVRDFRKTLSQFTDTFEDAHREFHTVMHDPEPKLPSTQWPGSESAARSTDITVPYDQREPILPVSGHSLKTVEPAPLEDAHEHLIAAETRSMEGGEVDSKEHR